MVDLAVSHLPFEDFNADNALKHFPKENDDRDLIDILNVSMDDSNADGNGFANIALILYGMDMKKYIDVFKNEGITVETFLNVTENDLKELGITDENDRNTIINNLKCHRSSSNTYAVGENHYEDLKIAKNVYNHLLFLQNYCLYVELQMKKKPLLDYRVNFKESAALYLRKFIEAALIQNRLLSEKLYSKNDCEKLIGKSLKMTNLKLPKYLQEKLLVRKKKLSIPRLIGFLGMSSLCFVIGKYLIHVKSAQR